ncbi:hypothetical protein BDF14DRAFT_751413 [Spinellus fusiger]|nr:hypothetical protein BDF14DRAFT_751413 [Spinellus fusiger]
MVLMDQRHTYMYWGTSNVSEPNKRISNAEDNAYQALHFNTMPCILSEYFVSQLLNQHCGGGINQLWTLYRRWQPDLVARIWRHQSVIMEYEILDFFEKIATHTQYTSPSQLQHKLQNTLLFQTLHNNPILFSKAHKKAAEWLVDLMDWRILRVWQHTCILLEHPHKLRRENNLKNNSAHSKDIYRNFTPVLQKFVHLQQGISTDTGAKSIAAQCSEAMNRLLDYTYIGSFEDIELRRNEAWLLALSSPSFIQDCTSFCIAWCSSQDSWNSEMDDVSYYLAWLVCPSNDDRVDAEAKCMKRWLLSLKASIGKDPSHIIDIITKSWREIFNGNDVVAMSVFVSIITTVTSEWSMKAWVLMTDHLLEQPHEENSVSIYSNSSACILLDHFSLWSEKNDTQNTVSQDKKLYDRVYQLVEYIEGRLKFNKSTKSI